MVQVHYRNGFSMQLIIICIELLNSANLTSDLFRGIKKLLM